MLCKLTLAAVAWVNMAMATAADEDSLINSYGTFTTEPEMQFDSRTTQPCAMWYNNDGSGSCEDLVADTFLNLSTFLDWNPSLEYKIFTACSNFTTGQSYCIDAFAADSAANLASLSSAATKTSTETPTAAPTTTQSSNGITTPIPAQPGMVDNCDKFYHVKSWDTCDDIILPFGISIDDLIKWNPEAGKDCSGLRYNTFACVSVMGLVSVSTSTSTATTTATAPGNGIATPQPPQPDMVDNCNKFHYISKGNYCGQITSYNGISQEDFAKWNPRVGTECTGMWADAYACVGVIGGTTTTTTTSTTSTPTQPTNNGIPTPQPTQPGMVSNCVKFHYISKGNYCGQITSYNDITQQDFAKWNPQVGQQCDGLWADAYACVEVAAFSLKTRYHAGCSGDIHNNVAVRVGEGYCMNTDCSVGSLEIDADGLCPDGEVQLSYWEQPGCSGKWFGFGYADKGTCRGLWSQGNKFKAIHLRCAKSQDDCVSKESCTWDAEPASNAC